jgi:hypothetical protein
MEIRRITLQGHPRQKVFEPLSQQNKLGVVAYTWMSSYVEGVGRRIIV